MQTQRYLQSNKRNEWNTGLWFTSAFASGSGIWMLCIMGFAESGRGSNVEQYAIYKPQEDTLGFQELQSMNSDVIAWITVYDTPIDYPVVQGKDNWEYVNKNAEGEYSLTGAIFMDSENNPDFQDFNTILYGHNMVPNVMFGSIKDLKNKPFTKHTRMVIYLFRIVISDWKSLH